MKFIFIFLMILSYANAEVICPNPELVPIGIMCPKSEVDLLKDWIPAAGQVINKDNYPKLFDFYLQRNHHFCDIDLTYCKNLDTRDNPKKEAEDSVFWYIHAN